MENINRETTGKQYPHHIPAVQFFSVPDETNDRSNAAVRLIYSCFERVSAVAVLLFTAPFLVVLAIMVRYYSKASPFILHRRVGLHGRSLWVLKVRSLWPVEEPSMPGRRSFKLYEYCDKVSFVKATPSPDSHGRWLSSFIRRASLDEIPQLLQVVIGQMALVGPRPITREEIVRYYDGSQEVFLSVKPGVVGLWQVSGRSKLSYQQRREFDLRYVRNRSVSFDLEILFRAIAVVVTMDGAQ